MQRDGVYFLEPLKLRLSYAMKGEIFLNLFLSHNWKKTPLISVRGEVKGVRNNKYCVRKAMETVE